jgi:hypothetical protein
MVKFCSISESYLQNEPTDTLLNLSCVNFKGSVIVEIMCMPQTTEQIKSCG